MLVQFHFHRFTQTAGALILLAAPLPGLTDQAEARQTRPQHELRTLLQETHALFAEDTQDANTDV